MKVLTSKMFAAGCGLNGFTLLAFRALMFDSKKKEKMNVTTKKQTGEKHMNDTCFIR